ncbi:putative acetyltransferase [Lachnotalea glycerini]|nr:GNAT family N-acetyltransferase [Lachnotalea glycerini]PXV88367.1 putative acetyltransferase [Lachnotalea glycerini]
MLFKNNKKKKEDGKQIQSLSYKEHNITRPLWETTFEEDSKEFIDYYYNNKVTDNSIWVAKEGDLILSMAQLNPYQIHLGLSIVLAHYIVGVATLEEYRRKGFMRSILAACFEQMYKNKEPFTYLMPAKEEYYTAFDFVTVYYQKSGILLETSDETELTFKNASEEDFKYLAWFSEEVLSEKYKVFVNREESYYQMIKAQYEAEHGGIICVYHSDLLVGYFFYGEYEAIEIMEPVCLDTYRDELVHVIAKKFKGCEKQIRVTAFDFLNEDAFKNITTKPTVMTRIVSLDMFVKYLKASEPVKLILQIEDQFIEQNNGIFELYIDDNSTEFERTSAEPEIKLSISEFTALCFYEILPKGIEEKANEYVINKLNKVSKFHSIFLNEFV